MNLGEKLRRMSNRFGFDVCRVGPKRLGRLLEADLRALVRGKGPIFDVGANTGRAARMFSKILPDRTIWSFEPGTEAFGELSSAPDLLPVKKFNLALSDVDGSATLHMFEGSQLNSLLAQEAEGRRYDPDLVPAGTDKVQTMRLDTFCKQQQVSEIEILKIDTQGFELHVLRGAEHLFHSGAVNLVYLEVHFVPLYKGQPSAAEIFEIMHRLGFGFISYYDAGRSPDGCIKGCDLLFRSIDAA